MSLLLDALKRAEDAKRTKKSEMPSPDDANQPAHSQTEKIAPVSELSLEEPYLAPSTPATVSRSAAEQTKPTSASQDYSMVSESNAPPKGSSSLSLVDESVAVVPASVASHNRPAAAILTQATQRTTSGAQSAQPSPAKRAADDLADLAAAQESIQRDAARNVFAAKQNAKKKSAVPSKTKWLMPLIAIIVVGIGAGGWYVWKEVASSSRSAYTSGTLRPAAPPSNAVSSAAPGAASTPTVAAPVVAELALPPLLPPPAKEMPLPKLVSAKQTALGEALTERELLAKRLMESNSVKSAKEPSVSLKLSQSIEPPRVSPTLLAAYAALSKGDYVQAKQRYTEVAQAEPFSLDAQLGLATAAARTGDNAAAGRYYRRVLELDPRNSTAISGLIAVSGDVKPEALEAELKTWVLKAPGSASLQFSLGNLYASQKRWTEAQQAYFEAYRIDSANADYLYNLAVSLDQLNQMKLALDYYQKALIQAGKTGGQFERASVQRRIGEINAGSKPG